MINLEDYKDLIDMNSEDMVSEELDYLESRVDGYIENMINERRI